MKYSQFDLDAAVERQRQQTENAWFKFVLFIVVVMGMCGVFA